VEQKETLINVKDVNIGFAEITYLDTEDVRKVVNMERTTNNIIESLTGMLVSIAKSGDKQEVESAIAIMEVGWAKMDEVLDPAWFNSELAKLWKESHKEKKEIKN